LRPDDIILITGKKRSGKSYFLKHILSLFLRSNVRIVIWDYNWEHNGDLICYDLNKVITGFQGQKQCIIYRPQVKTETAINQFCEVVNRFNNIVCVIEEVPLFAGSWYDRTIPQMKVLVDTGRFRGIGLICTARRVLKLCADIPYNSDSIFIFNMERPQDIKYLAEYVGVDDATFNEKLNNLPKYGYLWYESGNGLKTMPPIQGTPITSSYQRIP